jgi:hypothetical protein
MTDTYSDAGVLDEVETDVESTEVEEGIEEKPAKEKKESSRLSVPDGYTTPIGFKNALVEQGKVPADYRPQLVYAYVKNPGKKNPFPVKWTNGTEVFDTKDEAQAETPAGKEARPVVNLDEALAWWDEKEQRKAESAAQKDAAAQAGTDEKPTKKSRSSRSKKAEEVVEVEEDASAADFTEAQ